MNDLREQLLEVVDLRYEQRRIDRNPAHEDYARLSRLLNAKRNIRLSMATVIARKVTRLMSVYDCVTLGYESDANGEYEDGRRFLELAVKKSRSSSSLTRTTALRYMGEHYLDPGPEHSVRNGNEYYAAAVRQTEEDGRPYFVYATAFTEKLWAYKLENISDPGWEEHARRARELAEGLPEGFTYRQSEIDEIDALFERQRKKSDGPSESTLMNA